jgi:hypothetical protein
VCCHGRQCRPSSLPPSYPNPSWSASAWQVERIWYDQELEPLMRQHGMQALYYARKRRWEGVVVASVCRTPSRKVAEWCLLAGDWKGIWWEMAGSLSSQ